MKFIKIFIGCLMFFLLCGSSQNAFSQKKIVSSVLSGGSGLIANDGYILQGTVGQPIIGATGDSTLGVYSGFWRQYDEIVTEVEFIQTSMIPKEFRLEQNYPNPFNPTTTIEFSVPKQTFVTIKIFDILGRQVSTLVEEELLPGVYKVTFKPYSLASGIYFYQINTEEFVKTRKLMLLK